MNIKETALVLVEFQNDFLHAEGRLYGAVKEVVQATHMLDNTRKLITQARAQGMTIIHVPISFSSAYHEMGQNPTGILAVVKGAGACIRGSWGSQIIEQLTPLVDEIIIEGKSGISAFQGTNLDEILTRYGIRHIVLAGLLTHVCIESTVRSAYDQGYVVTALSDCMASLSQGDHEAALARFGLFAQVTSSVDFVQRFS